MSIHVLGILNQLHLPIYFISLPPLSLCLRMPDKTLFAYVLIGCVVADLGASQHACPVALAQVQFTFSRKRGAIGTVGKLLCHLTTCSTLNSHSPVFSAHPSPPLCLKIACRKHHQHFLCGGSLHRLPWKENRANEPFRENHLCAEKTKNCFFS